MDDDEFVMENNKIVAETYRKYRELNSTFQVLFREMLISKVTEDLLRALNMASDISDFSSCRPVWMLNSLIVHIEVHGRRGYYLSQAGASDISKMVEDVYPAIVNC
jgi:hypothetical protein